MIINRSVKIEEGQLIVTKRYADENLSKHALNMAVLNDKGTHYLWEWGKTSTVVLYELPTVFNVANFFDIARELGLYCESYIVDSKFTDATIMKKFQENLKKTVKG